MQRVHFPLAVCAALIQPLTLMASFALSCLPPAVLPPLWAAGSASAHRAAHQAEGRTPGRSASTSILLWGPETRVRRPVFLGGGTYCQLVQRRLWFLPVLASASLPPSPALPFISFRGESAPPPSSVPENSNHPSRAAEPIKSHRHSHKLQGHCCFWFQGEKWWVCSGHGGEGAACSCLACAQTLQLLPRLKPLD